MRRSRRATRRGRVLSGLAWAALLSATEPASAAWLATGFVYGQTGPFPVAEGAFAWIDLGEGEVAASLTGPEDRSWLIGPPLGESNGPRRWELEWTDVAWPSPQVPLGAYTRSEVGTATLAGDTPGSLRLLQLSNFSSLTVGQEVTLAWSAPPATLASDRVVVQLRDRADGAVLWGSPGPDRDDCLRPEQGSVSLTIPAVNELAVEAMLFRASDAVDGGEPQARWIVGTAGVVRIVRPVVVAAGPTEPPVPETVSPASGAVLTDRRPVVRVTFADPMWAGGEAVAVGPVGELPEPWHRWSIDRRTLLLGWDEDLPDGTLTVLLNPPGSERRLRRIDGVEVPANTVATSFSIGTTTDGPQWVGRTPDREWKWGETVVWEVVVAGEDLTYQWYRGEAGDRSEVWPDGEGARLEPGPMTGDVAGWVEVTDGSGRTVTSDTLRATLRASPAPVLLNFPTSYAAAPGGSVTLALTATDPDGLSWMAEWFEGVPGDTTRWVGTGASLERDALVSTQYWARLSNPVATANSPAALVNVDPITNVAQALQVWLAQAEVARPDRQPEADPDGDGLSNLWEYAVGGDPLRPRGVGLPPWGVALAAGGSLSGEVRLQVLDWPVGLELLTNTNLTDPWQPGPAPSISTEAGQRVYRWSWLPADPAHHFARWSIYLPFED